MLTWNASRGMWGDVTFLGASVGVAFAADDDEEREQQDDSDQGEGHHDHSAHWNALGHRPPVRLYSHNKLRYHNEPNMLQLPTIFKSSRKN